MELNCFVVYIVEPKPQSADGEMTIYPLGRAIQTR